MFAEFEKIVHQRVESGEPLTADEFTNIYYKLNEKYYGKSAIVDKQIGIEWARILIFIQTSMYISMPQGFLLQVL